MDKFKLNLDNIKLCTTGNNCFNPKCELNHSQPIPFSPQPCKFGISCSRPLCNCSHPYKFKLNNSINK